jgi:hypothetical protein
MLFWIEQALYITSVFNRATQRLGLPNFAVLGGNLVEWLGLDSWQGTIVVQAVYRPIMVGLRAIPMAMRVVLSGSRALGRISISGVPVTELVVKKPSCYPVWAIEGRSSETPEAFSLQVLTFGDA